MSNEIRIIVKAVDETAAGYAKAKTAANATASDIEGSMKTAGEKGGKALGAGISDGVKDGAAKGKKHLADIGGESGGSGGLFSSIKGGITKGLNSGFLEGIPAVAPILAGFAPLLGGVVGAGIIGGAGLGGVLGGVLLAAKDPRVKDAGKTLGTNILGGLADDAKVFVGPVMDSIGMIGKSFETTLRPKIQSIFSNSSQFVAPLTAGLLKGVDGLLGGLDKAIARAGPVMNSIGDLFADVGTAAGDMFEIVSRDSEDAAKALDTLSFVLSSAVKGVGYMILGLTEFYGVLDTVGTSIGNFSNWLSQDYPEATTAFMKHTAEAENGAMGLNEELGILQSRATGIAGPIATLSDEINTFSDASRNAFGAATNLGEAVLNAKEAFEKNGKTLATNTKAGLANRAAMSQVADTMKAAYNAQVALTGEGEKASDMANKNRRDFIKLAREGLGLAKGAAEDFADELGLIKAPKPIKIETNAAKVRADVRSLQAQINAMKGRTIPITVRVTTKGETLYGNQAPQLAHGGIKGAASGMNTSGLTWVGEHGPELVSLPAGSNVRSNPDSMRLAAQSGMGGGGKLEIVLRFDPSGAPAMAAGLMEGLRVEVRNQGGSVQQVLGVAGVS